MSETRIGTDLPLDISSRIEGLFSLVSEVTERVSTHPVLADLLRDYHEMAKEYILLFEKRLGESSPFNPREKWLKRHEMMDKLTREWQLIYSLACAMELGSSHLADFRPHVNQAIKDVGLAGAGEDFLLIPVFAESFSLVKVRYSSRNVSILNLPISVIYSPWELSVIWHEMAGLKVIEIRDRITDFLQKYAEEHQIVLPQEADPTLGKPLKELFENIISGARLDKALKIKVKEFLTLGGDHNHPQTEIWSQDWFEQLYEDACSVLAFGKDFVSVLEKILGRQARKISADRKHPDLITRLLVANRLLILQKGEAPLPQNDAERLTDSLLWAFIKQTENDPGASLPVAYETQAEIPELRRKLMEAMQVFNQNFGDLAAGTINERPFDFGPMASFAQKASDQSRSYSADETRTTQVREKLTVLFGDSDVNRLLLQPFSPPDELSFYEHTATDTYQTMYIGSSSHGGHYIFHLSHA